MDTTKSARSQLTEKVWAVDDDELDDELDNDFDISQPALITSEGLVNQAAVRAANNPLPYRTKPSAPGATGTLEWDFQDGMDIVHAQRGRGVFNKRGDQVSYKSEIKYTVKQDGPINPDTEGMVRKVTILVVEETAEAQRARAEKSSTDLLKKFVTVFGGTKDFSLTSSQMADFIAGKPETKWLILTQDRKGLNWQTDERVNRDRAEGKTRRYFCYEELSDTIKAALHKKLTLAKRREENNIPLEGKLAQLDDMIQTWKDHISATKDEKMRASLEAYLATMVAERERILNPPPPKATKKKQATAKK